MKKTSVSLWLSLALGWSVFLAVPALAQTPAEPNGTTRVDGGGTVHVATGFNFTVLLKSDGTLWAAGGNHFGQLADGSTEDRPTFVQMKDIDGNPMTGVVAVTAGYNFAVALKNDGTLWATGGNHYGQLADGTTNDRAGFVRMRDVDGKPMTGVVAVSSEHSLSYHTIALRNDGTVWAAGYNANGQLADGTTTNRPGFVLCKDERGAPMAGAMALAAGHNFTVVLKEDGTLWASGGNRYGQLADGSNEDRAVFVPMKGADGKPMRGLAAPSPAKEP